MLCMLKFRDSRVRLQPAPQTNKHPMHVCCLTRHFHLAICNVPALSTAPPLCYSGFYFVRATRRSEAFMGAWLAAAYNASGDGADSWEQDRFSKLLRARPPAVR